MKRRKQANGQRQDLLSEPPEYASHVLGWRNVNASLCTMLGWLPKNHPESHLKADSSALNPELLMQ